MTHDLLRALFLAFGVLLISFGVFFWWLTSHVRGQNGDVVWWGIANGASHVGLGTMVIVGLLFRAAMPYAVTVAGVLLVVRVLAGRRLRKRGGGLR